MNRKEIKDLLPILQAFAEGKTIEMSSLNGWVSQNDLRMELLKSNPRVFRIKQDPKYRPFKDADECWNEMQKHQPLGLLNDKKARSHSLITYIETNEEGVFINGIGNYSFNEIMEKFTFADGTPFGVKVEE